MAEVYRAQDLTLSRMVALKVMLPQYAADSGFTQRFRQEAAAAANLQSPYIVNVYDWGKDEDTYFIVMEYVRGSDLKTAIKERGAINQRKVAEIGSQVCQALSVAHRLDIIHRDIKPQNIMIQPDGNVKVMDFGIAHAKNSVMTQTSSVLGTAHYISPEQAQGKELSAASDIYSLGIVLYEAATGKLPFDGPDAVSVAMKQVSEQPLPPSRVNPDIDPSLEKIIMRALEKDPSRRFETTGDMKRALDDFLLGRSYEPYASRTNAAETHILGGVPVQYGPANATEIMPSVAGSNRISSTDPASANKYISENMPPKKKRTGLVVTILLLLFIAGGLVAAFANGMFDSNDILTVPSVEGQTQEEAEQTIRNEGFVVGSISVVKSNDVEEGKVVSQDPEGNSKAHKGTKINLVISGGEDQAVVPDLTGLTAEEANAALEQVGLHGQAGNGEHSDSVPANQIIRQDQKAGTRVPAGSTVTYYPSLGTEALNVPNISGMTENAALNALQNAGFKVTTSRENSDTVAKGLVISYNPSGKADKGTTIKVVISNGPEPEPEPKPEPEPEPKPEPKPNNPDNGNNNDHGQGENQQDGNGNSDN